MNPPELQSWVPALALAVPGLPLVATLLLGLALFRKEPPSEKTTSRVAGVAVTLSFTASAVLSVIFLLITNAPGQAQALDVHLGNIVHIDEYTLSIEFLIDRLSIPMVLTTGLITAIVMRFSIRYLHRDPGFLRFFLLLCVFDVGMQVLVLAGSYDLLFIGWEMVGVSSFMLIAFFQLRDGPMRGGLRALVTYRATDVGLLIAGILLHQATGSTAFSDAFGTSSGGVWPHATTHLDAAQTTPLALLLLFATMGKSGLFPLSGWLPRAMEGPTPSSALFYGALSVHAGVYLLLRSAPLLESSTFGEEAVIVVGLLTVLTSTLAGRVQSDVKSALAYATSTQVGVMVTVVGVATWMHSGALAMAVVFMMIAHTALRTLQLLRAPSALRDMQEIRAALPEHQQHSRIQALFPVSLRSKVHALAHRRFLLDELLERCFVMPTLWLAHHADRLERRWVGLLSGAPSPEPEAAAPSIPVKTSPEGRS